MTSPGAIRSKRQRSTVALLAGLACALSGLARAELPPEPLQSGEYPPLGAHTVAISSYEGLSMRSYLIDADQGTVVGMVPGSMNSMLRFGADGNFYSADTFFEKLWRGKRTDQITVYDGKTGAITHEIEIPPSRFQSYTLAASVDFTPDGHYLLQFNMTPAGSVTVVDVTDNKVLTEIPTAGCGLVFPYAPTAFAMLCADGGLLRVRFAADGTSEKSVEKPFFDPENDPLMQNGVIAPSGGIGYFVSYEGLIYELDFAGKKLFKSKPWSVRGAGEEGWWPSGWEPLAYNPAAGILYVLMSETEKWHHPLGGEEVWAFDLKTHKRLWRKPFEEPLTSIDVSQDASPLLYGLTSENETLLYIADGKTGELLREVEELGSYPFVIVPTPAMLLSKKAP